MEMIRSRGRAKSVVQVIPNLTANNLLHKFFITSKPFCDRDSDNGVNHQEEEEEEEDNDIELTLGLSLNGQFGTDPRSRKRKNFELRRSSSIPEGFLFDEQRSDSGDLRWTVGRGVSDIFQLDRTRSLPVETGMEIDHTEMKRKRSEMKKRFEVVPAGPTTTKSGEVSGMEKARHIIEDMPCVSTRDVGADGKRVQGFLYSYGGKKEEVKIVCVCHGSFLSPAEFVRHGGGTVSTVSDEVGGDVATNPLRHIVVKLPSSSL